jgi:hypothetical protein
MADLGADVIKVKGNYEKSLIECIKAIHRKQLADSPRCCLERLYASSNLYYGWLYRNDERNC